MSTRPATPTPSPDLPPPRRHPAGDRAGRGPGALAASRRARRAARRHVPAADRWPAGSVERHRTLRATIEWSYDLLRRRSRRCCPAVDLRRPVLARRGGGRRWRAIRLTRRRRRPRRPAGGAIAGRSRRRGRRDPVPAARTGAPARRRAARGARARPTPHATRTRSGTSICSSASASDGGPATTREHGHRPPGAAEPLGGFDHLVEPGGSTTRSGSRSPGSAPSTATSTTCRTSTGRPGPLTRPRPRRPRHCVGVRRRGVGPAGPR